MVSFNRIYSITISPNLLIENLKIKFEIKKSLQLKSNFSRVDIYNLSEKERNAISSNYIQLSFAENTSTKTIIDTIIQKINLPLRFSNLKPQNIKNGYSFVGTVSDALQDLAMQYDFEWSIQNGQIQILTKNSSTTLKAFLLSAETGLIESPNRTIKNKDFEKKEKGEYSVVCLLNPQLEVGDLISIDSSSLKGTFLIKELTHIGDNMGNEWYTKLIVVDR